MEQVEAERTKTSEAVQCSEPMTTHDTKPETDGAAPVDRNQKNRSWIPEWAWKATLPAIGIALIALDYFVGKAFHHAFLDFFGVDESVFPQSKESYLIDGVSVFCFFGFDAIKIGQDHPLILLTIFFVIPFLFPYLAWLDAYEIVARVRKENKKPKQEPKRSKYSIEIKDRYNQRIRFVYGLGAIYGILAIAAISVAVPCLIGEGYGLDYAKFLSLDYASGCEKAAASCVTLKKDGKEVGKGFRIAQSSDRIAIFLNGKTQEYSLSGYSLEIGSRLSDNMTSPLARSLVKIFPPSSAKKATN